MRSLERIIKNEAFAWKVDYKPGSDDETPQDYAEHGYIAGAQMMATRDGLHLLREWMIDVAQEDGTSKRYVVPATSARDAQLMAFILDRGLSGATLEAGVIEQGHMELARMYTDVVISQNIKP